VSATSGIKIGCCGWAGSQTHYLSQFPVVEIQSTFYDPPAARVATRWRTIASPGFAFCIKAWQLITHSSSSPTYRRLRKPVETDRKGQFGSFQNTDEVWWAWTRTLEIATAVRAEVVLFQCPASFQATRQNTQNLSRFFEKIGPLSFRLAWEPRGVWPPEIIRDLCAEHNLIHCVDPLICQSTSRSSLYWRLHGKGSYSYRYTDEDLASLRTLLLAEPWEKAYVLFNNVSMREDAMRFRKTLELN
jgi:uncharacterized protein YecE (DUF72 family)